MAVEDAILRVGLELIGDKFQNQVNSKLNQITSSKKSFESITDALNDSISKGFVEGFATVDKAPMKTFEDIITETSSNFTNRVASNFDVLKQKASQYNVALHNLGKNDPLVRSLNKQLHQQGLEFGFTGNQIDKVIKKTKVLDFQFLSLIFGGQYLKRVFGGALKSIIGYYDDLTQKNSEFGRATNKLSANFGYLKFSIANALNQPWVANIIEYISDAFEYLADVVGSNKWKGMAILGFLAFFTVTGGIMEILGNIATLKIAFAGFNGLKFTWATTAFNGIKKLATLAWTSIVTGITSIKTALTSLSLASLAPWLAVAGILAGGIAVAYAINKKHLDSMGLEVDGFFNNLKSIMVTFWAGLQNISNQFVGFFKQLWSGIESEFSGGDFLEGFTEEWENTMAKAKEITQDEIGNQIDFAGAKIVDSSKLGDLLDDNLDLNLEDSITALTDMQTQLSTLNSDQLEVINTEYDNMNSNFNNLIDLTPDLIDNVVRIREEFSNQSEIVTTLNEGLDKLVLSLNELNGQTFSYTVKEKRVSTGSTLFSTVFG